MMSEDCEVKYKSESVQHFLSDALTINRNWNAVFKTIDLCSSMPHLWLKMHF
jgi:hypothetical protein